MDELLAGLKAIAETTRIRILFILSHGELNVSELTYILGQSQPRVSRHLKLMAEAGLLSRNKEGNWVLFRLRSEGLSGALARALVEMLPGRDAVLSGDLARLEDIRSRRADCRCSGCRTGRGRGTRCPGRARGARRRTRHGQRRQATRRQEGRTCCCGARTGRRSRPGG